MKDKPNYDKPSAYQDFRSSLEVTSLIEGRLTPEVETSLKFAQIQLEKSLNPEVKLKL